jgi:hypothetical protein
MHVVRRLGDVSWRLERLDFVYTPSADVAADVAALERVGARVVFAIESSGTRVAATTVGEGDPLVMFADHLDGDRPILVYRVDDLDSAIAGLDSDGLPPEHRFEIPQGPCATFRTGTGHRLALYQLTRPDVASHFDGRRDF